jgi:hypothetical protein
MKYKEITIDQVKFIEMTDASGQVSMIPCDLANSDYQAYLANETKTK